MRLTRWSLPLRALQSGVHAYLTGWHARNSGIELSAVFITDFSAGLHNAADCETIGTRNFLSLQKKSRIELYSETTRSDRKKGMKKYFPARY